MDVSAVVPGIWVLQHFSVGRQEGLGCQILGQGRFSAAAAAVLYGKILHVLCSSGGMGWKA